MHCATSLYHPPNSSSGSTSFSVAPYVVASEAVLDPWDEQQRYAPSRALSVSIVARTPAAAALPGYKSHSATADEHHRSHTPVVGASALSATTRSTPSPPAATPSASISSAAATSGEPAAAAVDGVVAKAAVQGGAGRATPDGGRESVSATPVDPAMSAPLLRPPWFDIVLLRSRPVLADFLLSGCGNSSSSSSPVAALTQGPEVDFVHLFTSPSLVNAVSSLTLPDWTVPADDEGPFFLVAYVTLPSTTDQQQQHLAPAASSSSAAGASGGVSSSTHAAASAGLTSGTVEDSSKATPTSAPALAAALASSTASAADVAAGSATAAAVSTAATISSAPPPQQQQQQQQQQYAKGLHVITVLLYNLRTSSIVASATSDFILEAELSVLRCFLLCAAPPSASPAIVSELNATVLISVGSTSTATSVTRSALSFEKAPHVVPVNIKLFKAAPAPDPVSPLAAAAAASSDTVAVEAEVPLNNSNSSIGASVTTVADPQPVKKASLLIAISHARSSPPSSLPFEALFGSSVLQSLCAECRAPIIAVDVAFTASSLHFVLSCLDGGVHIASTTMAAAAAAAVTTSGAKAVTTITSGGAGVGAVESHTFQLDVPAHQVGFFLFGNSALPSAAQQQQQQPLMSLLRKVRRAAKRRSLSTSMSMSKTDSIGVPQSTSDLMLDGGGGGGGGLQGAPAGAESNSVINNESITMMTRSGTAVSNAGSSRGVSASAASTISATAAATTAAAAAALATQDLGILTLDVAGQISILRCVAPSQVWMTQTIVFSVPSQPVIAMAATRRLIAATGEDAAACLWISAVTSDRFLRLLSCEFIDDRAAAADNKSAAVASVFVSPASAVDLQRPVSAIYSLDCTTLASLAGSALNSNNHVDNSNADNPAMLPSTLSWPGVAVLTTDAGCETLFEAASGESSDSLLSCLSFLESLLM